MTPSRWAAFYGYHDVLKALMNNGAQDELDQFGQNLVFYAAKNGNIECLEFLRLRNADFNIVNNEGNTASDKAPKGSESERFILNVRKDIIQRQQQQQQQNNNISQNYNQQNYNSINRNSIATFNGQTIDMKVYFAD